METKLHLLWQWSSTDETLPSQDSAGQLNTLYRQCCSGCIPAQCPSSLYRDSGVFCFIYKHHYQHCRLSCFSHPDCGFYSFFFFFRPFLQFFKITQGTNISSFCASGKAVDLINIVFTVLPTLTSGSEGSFRLAFHPQKKQETGFEISLSWFKLSNSHWVIYENTMWYMYVC